MPTFSSILQSFPEPQEVPTQRPKRIGAFIFFCLFASLVLCGIGFYWQQRPLIYAVFVPLSLAIVAMLAGVFFDVKDSKEFFNNTGTWMADGLDVRFEQEKRIAAELATTDLVELQRMKTRLEADFLRTERWLDVLKPLSMLAPAVLILVSVGLLRLPEFVQDICKVAVASVTVGAVVGVVAVYNGLLKLRTLSSTLHYAIELAEQNKKPGFRKVSRKRR